MLKKSLFILILMIVGSLVFAACSASSVPVPMPESAVTPVLPAVTVSTPGQVPTPHPVSITDVTWSEETHAIEVQLNSWPGVWPGWKLILDDQEIPLENGTGSLVVRPNAPLEQPPNGLILGTLPWVTGLDQVDFPCCGALQLSIPGSGLTERYPFNLSQLGCKTASPKTCPSDWTLHDGDMVINANETVKLENTKLIQKGNIYVKDGATLEIVNSELMIGRGDTPTIHVYFFVDPKATLIIDHSRIYPGPDGGLVCVRNYGITRLTHSPTSIHYFDMSADARLIMDDSEMVYTIGGLLQVTGGHTKVTNSTLGALGLKVPAQAHLEISGLKSGMTFDHWDVHEMIPEADYELTLDNTNLLQDDFTGELKHGPYERGWIFFLDPEAHVRLSDSDVRKVFLDVRDDSATFRDLKIGLPSSLTYRDIILSDVVVEGEWPFTIENADVTLINSNYLFLQPQGSSTIKLIDSHMVEFIPRDFSGTISFENGEWTNAGEILGGVEYHSGSNHFKMKGSLKMGSELRDHLQWHDAIVDREFEVILTDGQGAPIRKGLIKIAGKEYWTDSNGRTVFVLSFDENNYNQPIPMETWLSGDLIAQQTIDFFTDTPVRIRPE